MTSYVMTAVSVFFIYLCGGTRFFIRTFFRKRRPYLRMQTWIDPKVLKGFRSVNIAIGYKLEIRPSNFEPLN